MTDLTEASLAEALAALPSTAAPHATLLHIPKSYLEEIGFIPEAVMSAAQASVEKETGVEHGWVYRPDIRAYRLEPVE